MTPIVDYRGKRVIVTGCFSGIGEATARLLLEAGAEVHGIDFRTSSLELKSCMQFDLRDPKGFSTVTDEIGGRVDALFNCAGLAATAPSLDVMKVNFLGLRALVDAVLPLMPAGAAIVSTSSRAGMGWSRRLATIMELVGTPTFTDGLEWCAARPELLANAYALSKEALIVWTMTQAVTVIKRGIRVNCTLPGSTETPMLADLASVSSPDRLAAALQPIGRRATAEEQAAPLLFLNSDAASYLNGVVLPADGGFAATMSVGASH